jgi:hypothetical protein
MNDDLILREGEERHFGPFLARDNRTVLVTDPELLRKAYVGVADEMIRSAKRRLEIRGTNGRNDKHLNSYNDSVGIAEYVRAGHGARSRDWGSDLYHVIYWDMIGEFNKMGLKLDV